MSSASSRVLVGALAVVVVACGSDEPSDNGRAALAIVESQWRDNGYLRGGDAFSARERECIARNGDHVDLDGLGAASLSEASPEIQEFVARNADECYSDPHLQSLFMADMEAQAFSTAHARCMAPGMLGLVREHGFADVFVGRTVAVAGRITELRQECGVD